MAFTYDTADPVGDRNQLRIHIGDVRYSDGPAPDRSNLDDELLDYFLEAAGSVPGAVALAFDHLAALWISRPIFGPGELSTIHVDMFRKFTAAADMWRARDTEGDGELGSTTVVRVGSFNRVDGYSDNGSEYT